MKNLQTNLKFYDDIEKQYHRIYFNSSKKGILSASDSFPPFQISDSIISTFVGVTSVLLYDANSDQLYNNITSDITLYNYQSGSDNYTIYYGDTLSSPISNGIYYLEIIIDGRYNYYSDIIQICDDLVPESINTIAKYTTVEGIGESAGIKAKATLYHLIQGSSTYRYFDAIQIFFNWNGNTESIFFIPGYTLSSLRSSGWNNIANGVKSNQTISNDFEISAISDSYGYKGIRLIAKQSGSDYNIAITTAETYAGVTDYTNNSDYEGAAGDPISTTVSFFQTIDVPQPWKWYNSLSKTYFKRYPNSYKKGAVQITNNQFIPFQIKRTHISYPLTNWYLRNPDTDQIVIDLLPLLSTEPVLNYVAGELQDYIIYYGSEKFSSNVSCGVYYCELTDGINTWYSDLIQVYGENIIPQRTTYLLWTDEGKLAYKTGGYIKWRD